MTKVALVDDDLASRRAISRLLRSRGYECIAYDSAESALGDSGLAQMDCLLIDIGLPGMDGFELRDRLHDRGSHVPHVFVTACAESDFPSWRTRIRDSVYLKKPVEDRPLFSVLEKLVKAGLGLPEH